MALRHGLRQLEERGNLRQEHAKAGELTCTERAQQARAVAGSAIADDEASSTEEALLTMQPKKCSVTFWIKFKVVPG